MDRPLGPRQPDKRHAAYQDIFGRTGAPQQPPLASRSYAQAYPPYPPGTSQQPYYQQPVYQDRRTSRESNYAPSVYSQAYAQSQPAVYAQSYYPSPPPAAPQAFYPNYTHAGYSPAPVAYPQTSLVPPSNNGRAQSIASSRHNPGIIAPRPEEPPDPALEALMQNGMTPAQAYQYQVYLNTPMNQGAGHTPYGGSAVNLPDGAPRLGLNLEAVDGRLGIDFGSEAGSSPSEGSTEDSGGSRREYRTTITPQQILDYQQRPSHSSRLHSLQVDTGLAQMGGSSNPSITTSTTQVSTGSTSSSTMPEVSGSSGRRSSDSTRTVPGSGTSSKRDRSYADRSRSMSAAMTPSIRSMFDATGKPSSSRPPVPSSAVSSPSSSRPPHDGGARRTPIVYPALLSRVAQAFQDRITLGERLKDGLTYTDAFDGREAVDKIAYIIKTTDRNLALLLGRALDAQKFFHDVTYDHRLRDSGGELYQFRTKIPSPFVSGDLTNGEGENGEAARPPLAHNGSAHDSIGTQDTGFSTPSADESVDSHGDNAEEHGPSPLTPTQRKRSASVSSSDEEPLPSGVFTLLTDCYSPTCSRDRLCYSIACPRRLEQQARLNMKPQPGLKKQISRESLGDYVEPGTLWIHSVPKEIVDSVSDTEKKRQEAINEVIYTERDFVRDMEYLRDAWINPLKSSDVIPEIRRTDFLEQVFWNIHDIIAVNTRLRDALNKRQKHYAVVERLGDILLDAVPHFGPFVSYGAHQLYGKYEFEKEKSANPAFAAFVETTERLPESRKLELNGYLTKPTTRLARYPLLLEAVLKHTPEDSPDKIVLPQVIVLVREFLGKVNTESGRTENRFNLLQLDQQLVFRQGEQVDLRLQEEGRELVYKGALKKRGGTQGDSGELQVFLFDHALLMVKQKTKHEQYKVYRRPIPLELLVVSAITDEHATTRKDARSKQTLLSRNSLFKNGPHAPIVPIKVDSKGGFSITFVHLGRKYYQMTLWASTHVSQRKWMENIEKQQELMRERSTVFVTDVLSEGFFVGANKVNCAAPFDGGRRMVYGTDDGVYLSDFKDRQREPVKVLALLDVTQVDVLQEFQLLVVLSERQVITFPMESLDPHDPMAGLKRAKRISSHTTFFKAGYCLGKALVCIVKASPLSSTIKTLEPIDQNLRGRSKPTFKKLLQGGNDTLRVFREFYIPVESSSIHFLKTGLCVGCTKGFEIVDLKTLDTQGLLDPADESLEFVQKREGLKPMAIYRIYNEFLLCYNEFAFYINRNGWRSRKDFMVHWEGSPTGFALAYPYVLAFEPTFVEIRNVENGSMAQIIQGNNLRLLFADVPPSTTHTSNSSVSQNPYQSGQAGYGYNPYDYQGSSVGSSYSSRQSVNSQYGGPSPNGQFPTPNPYQRPSGFGREEIIMVSDDRVMTLRMAGEHPLPPVPASDGASVYSLPRG